MCRKYFSGSSTTRKGCYDLGENFGVSESAHTYNCSDAIKEVATEMNVPLIDLTTLTKNLFESYGDAACTSQLFCTNDATHPKAMGAIIVARLCAQEMAIQNILASYINTTKDVLLNPINYDFGVAY